ncbi:MAG: hypothetical protein ISR96_06645 [Nitrospira sp.]|nr:hypothetical protein [Nitrospira sp.]
MMTHRQDYIKKMELKKKAKLDAGLLSEKHPDVVDMVMLVTYYHKGENPILLKRTINYFPTSHAYFNLDCMIKGCENGFFDLTKTVRAQIKGKKKVVKGTISCGRKECSLTPKDDAISYEINIKYSRAKKK